MKFTCTQGNLLNGLSQVVPVSGRNSQLPILQHVLIEAEGNSLRMTATDLEVGVKVVIGGKIEGEGSFTVPARSFLDYVSQLPSTHPIILEHKKGGLFVKTEGFQAQFPTSEADDYPLLPKDKKGDVLTLRATALCGAINQAVFAAARDETRPEIRSVYIKGAEGKVSVAATDSFRLAEEIMSLDEALDFSLLLPLHCAQEIVRLFNDKEEIQISPQDNHVTFYGEGVELSSRLVDGAYPDYQQIIPTTWKTRVSVVRDDFVRALKTLTVFLPRDSRRVQLIVRPEKGKIMAMVVGSEAGQGEVELLCEGTGDEVEVLVNVQYLVEGLQHINTSTCFIELGGNEAPIVFRPDEEKDQYVYVVMPIQAQ